MDYYALTVTDTAGTYTFLTYDLATNICSLDTTLILLSTDGTTVLSSNDNASTVSGPVPNPCSTINGRFNSPGKYYIRVAGSGIGSPNTGNYTIRVTFNADYLSYPTGLTTHWKMDETTGGIADSRGTYPLTANGTTNSIAGYFGNARGPYHTASTNFRNNNSVFATQYFLVEFWMKSADSFNLQGLVGNFAWGGSGSGTGWSVLIQNPSLRLYLSNGTTTVVTSTANVFDDQWHYVVVAKINTVDSVKVRMYVDGQSRSEATSTLSTLWQVNSFFTVGSYYDNIDRYFRGYLDDVVFWANPPTTWAEVDQIVANRWNSGSPKYYK